MIVDKIGKLFRPASVAVVGASQRPDAVGSVVVANLIRWDFPGDIYPVNPRYDEIQGRRCYPSLSSIGCAPEAVFLAVPAASVPALLDEAGACGASAAYVNGSGFIDAGTFGSEPQEGLMRTARAHGMALCGPNNMGLINLADRIPLWTSPDLPIVGPGPVAIISQSGAIAISLTYDAGHFCYAYVVTTGNEAICTAADYLAFMIEDPRIRVVQLFLETVRDTERFAAAARRAHECGIALVVLKVGRSAQSRAAIGGHTAAVAGDDSVYDAYFRSLGIVRVDNLDQMIEATKIALVARPLRRPGRIAVVTLSGGEAALVADSAQRHRIELATLSDDVQNRLVEITGTATVRRNPVDAWGRGWDPAGFNAIVTTIAGDSAVDGVLCAINPASPRGHDEAVFVGMANACGLAAKCSNKLFGLVATVASAEPNDEVARLLEDHAIPYLRGLDSGLAALVAWRDREGVRRNANASLQGPGRTAALSRSMNEAELFAALNDGGACFARSRAVASTAEAIRAASELGYPVALKGTAPDLLHKTELGLVRLGLGSPEILRAVAADMGPRLRRYSRDKSATLVVQAMTPTGFELLVSARNDLQFGTVVVVGLGGIHVELFRDTATRLGPIDAATGEEMLGELSGAALLRGFRGQPAVDIAAAARFIAILSLICAANAERVEAIEVNPLIVLPEGEGAVAVDLVVTWRPDIETKRERTEGKVLHEL